MFSYYLFVIKEGQGGIDGMLDGDSKGLFKVMWTRHNLSMRFEKVLIYEVEMQKKSSQKKQ